MARRANFVGKSLSLASSTMLDSHAQHFAICDPLDGLLNTNLAG
jgi:hypothetical protein